MSAVRTMVQDGGLSRNSRAGDNPLSSMIPYINAVDAAQVITVEMIAGGIVYLNALSAGRVLTTDTAVAILAANPWMDIGDSFMVFVSIQDAFAGTWAAGAGVTLDGKATTVASGSSWIVVTKTGAATVRWMVL